MRKIIHIDMDAFFAQVEQRDQPSLRGLPVVVGGSPEGRGVVAAASYEARAYGVYSAMAMARALRLCPHLVVVPPRFERYREVSRQLRAIFARYTDLIEPLSLDEAYLDVSSNHINEPSATRIAERIRADVAQELNLTCSAGVAPCKFIAKIASDMNKPNGCCVIPPQRVVETLAPMSVRRIPGIGPATEERLLRHGVTTIVQLREAPDAVLSAVFGRSAALMRQRSWGEDESPVIPHRPRKSVGIEDTFAEDIGDLDGIHQQLMRLAEGLEQRRAAIAARGRCLTLKLRFADFSTITRSQTCAQPLCGAEPIAALAKTLLEKTEAGQRPLRLLGLSLSQLQSPVNLEAPVDKEAPAQLTLPFAEW
ncbi:MAG: DNA polymerase IV [Planctomycetota bacterium]|nr:MAG: DNA polymerase IV [Planctomycetota bacterium]